MSNIKLTLQYDGTRYLGWQRPVITKQFHTDYPLFWKS